MYNVSVIISINALMCKHHFYTVPSDDAYVVCEISKCDASQEIHGGNGVTNSQIFHICSFYRSFFSINHT